MAAVQCTVAVQSPLCTAVQAVLAALGDAVVVTPTDTFTVTAVDGKPYVGINTIMSVVGAQYAPKYPTILGTTAAQRANIAQWVGLATHVTLEAATTADAEALFDGTAKFVAGTDGATLADATLMSAVGATVVATPGAYPKLFHWARNVAKEPLLSAVVPDFAAPAATGSAAVSDADTKAAKSAAAPKFAKPTAEEIAARRIEKEKAKAIKDAAKAAAKEAGGGDAQKKTPAALASTDLDLRIGKIVAIDKHPSADRLFVSSIDVGEESGPRTIVSGLVQFYQAEQLKDQLVLVICNMKAMKLQGVASHGMVLCASTEQQGLSVVMPPAGTDVAAGNRVTIGGKLSADHAPIHKKIMDLLAKLHTDETGAVMWDTEACAVNGTALTSSIKSAIVK